MTAPAQAAPVAGAAPDLTEWLAAALRALPSVVADVRANAPPPTPSSASDVADVLERAVAVLPSIIAVLRLHRGVIAGAAELLDRLAEAGVPHAEDIRAAILAVPGALDAAETLFPRITWMLTEFQPAATGVQGDAPPDGHRMGRG